jgi:hypothetical protein
MPTANTPLLGLALPVTGELSGSWGTTVNDAITSLLDDAVAGTTSITVDADITLTTTALATNQSRQAIILWNPAAGTTTRNITAPAQSKIYTVINASGGTQSIVFRGVGPTTGVTIVKGESAVVAWNGTDFIKVSNAGGSASFTNVTVSGTTTLSGLTASTALALDASKNVVSVTNTGTGDNVLATSPTLVTPALGTPSSGTVTNLTGTASININGTVGATTANTGAFTTLTSSSGATIQGLTVGRGAGAVATNTAAGATALASNTSGVENTSVGNSALRYNTSGAYNTGVGSRAGELTSSGSSNTSLGRAALAFNEFGSSNTAIGESSMFSGFNGSDNTAIGRSTLQANDTGSRNVALGSYAAKYSVGNDNFFVDSRDRTDSAGEQAGALLYGKFNATPASQTLTTNAKLTATYGVVTRVNSQTTIASPWAWDSTLYDQQEITALANALTINADAGTPSNGQQTVFRFTDNGTARALTWTTGTSKSFRAVGVLLPTTTIANKTLYVGCVYNSTAARWDVLAVAQEA